MTRGRHALLLVAGMALVVAANMRWGVGVLAWIAPIPFLCYLRHTSGGASRALLVVAVIVAWSLAVAKIATAPMPLTIGLMFGAIIGVFFALGYVVWDLTGRRARPALAPLAFAAAMVAAEWLQTRVSDLGSWGAVAYSQLGNLPLLQVASLFGAAGVGFLVYWTGAALETAIATRQPRVLAPAAIALGVAYVFGAARLAAAPGASATVAGVVTDASFGPGPLPAADVLRAIDDSLFARTTRAARAGARLVSWTEVATAVMPADERALVDRGAAVARAEGIELVIAYAVPRPTAERPATYENKDVWLHPDGSTALTYEKRHPVPGEPAIPGTSLPMPVSSVAGTAAAALCYDFDFPTLTGSAGFKTVGLAVVPSSDWRGIDPLHTQMTALRAVEGGYSVLRSTRMGLSAGIDPTGRVRASVSSFESAERVLLVSLPTVHVPTLYQYIGDALVYAALLLLAALAVRPTRAGVYRTTSAGGKLAESPTLRAGAAMSKSLTTIVALLLLAAPAFGQAPDAAQESAPRRVIYGLRARFPKAEIQKWTKEKEGASWIYDFEFTQDGLRYEADISEDGVVQNWEVEVAASELPPRVQQVVNAKYQGANVTHVMRVNEVHNKKDVFIGFEVELHTADGKDVELTLSPDGRILEEGS